jgi:hypothetical protein
MDFLHGQSRGFIGTPGPKRAFQLINRDNISIVVCRQQSTFNFQHTLISKNPSDICFLSSQTKETSYIIPLYIYKSEDDIFHDLERAPNLNPQYISDSQAALVLPSALKKEVSRIVSLR